MSMEDEQNPHPAAHRLERFARHRQAGVPHGFDLPGPTRQRLLAEAARFHPERTKKRAWSWKWLPIAGPAVALLVTGGILGLYWSRARHEEPLLPERAAPDGLVLPAPDAHDEYSFRPPPNDERVAGISRDEIAMLGKKQSADKFAAAAAPAPAEAATAPVPTAAPAKAPVVVSSPAGTVTFAAQFSQNPPPAPAAATKEKPTAAVLVNFEFVQSGSVITIIDSDGSVYRGIASPGLAEADAVTRSMTAAGQRAAEARLAREEKLQDGLMTEDVAHAQEALFGMAPDTQSVRFRAEGTNKTLGSKVIIQGILASTIPAPPASLNAGSRMRADAAPTRGVPAAPQTATIRAQLEIGDSPPAKIEAAEVVGGDAGTIAPRLPGVEGNAPSFP